MSSNYTEAPDTVGVGPTGSIPSATLLDLIERCEQADGPDRRLGGEIMLFVKPFPNGYYGQRNGMRARGTPEIDRVEFAADYWPNPTASIDAALDTLPTGADWRRLTPTTTSAYAANPYGGTAQVRHDGNGATVPLQICAAGLKIRLAVAQKVAATLARKVAP